MEVNLSDAMITTLSIALEQANKEYRRRLTRTRHRQATATAQTGAQLLPGYRRRARAIANLEEAIDRNQDALDMLAGCHSVALAQEGRC